MAIVRNNGLERTELHLHPSIKKKIKDKAKKKVPPLSPKKYMEELITNDAKQTNQQ